MANEIETVETEEKSEQEIRADGLNAERATRNAEISGKGYRWFWRLTKGKTPKPYWFRAFDKSIVESLPETYDELMVLSDITDETLLLGMTLDGLFEYNAELAADPIAAFVDASWDDEAKKSFKISVKNLFEQAQGEDTLEQCVEAVKPGVMRGQARKRKAEAEAKRIAAEAKAQNDATTAAAGIPPVATPTVTVVPKGSKARK